MQGCRESYKRQGKWHTPYSPYDCRVYRTVAIVTVAGALAMAIVQGCRGQLNITGFSSPSSGAGSCLVQGSRSLSKTPMLKVAMGAGDLSALSSAPDRDMAVINWARPVDSGAVSSGSIDELLETLPGWRQDRPDIFLILTILMFLIINCAAVKGPTAGVMLRAGPDDRVISGRTHGGAGRSDASAATDGRPAIIHNDIPITCFGDLPQAIRRRLRLRDAGVQQ